MRRHLPMTLLLPSLALLGCGTGLPVAPPTSPLLQALPGNWQMQVQSSVSGPAKLYFNLLGELSVSGSTVSGVFQVPAIGLNDVPPCTSVTLPQTVTFSGSLGNDDLLTLTSAAFSGSVATLQLQLPLTKVVTTGIAKGTIAIVGGACAYPSTPVFGVLVPPLNGTYAGTFALQQFTGGQPISGPSIPATVAYTQSAANAEGQFPLSATISMSSTACTFSATITGIITGLDVKMFTGSPGYTSTVPNASLFGGAPVSATQSLGPTLELGTATPTCPEGVYQGEVFTLQ